LAFIGLKLALQATHKVITASVPEIPSLVSLGVILSVLAASVVLSLKRPLIDSEDEGQPTVLEHA